MVYLQADWVFILKAYSMHTANEANECVCFLPLPLSVQSTGKITREREKTP